MKSKSWRWATLYLVVGIFWSAFAAEKDIEAGIYYEGNAHVANVTVLVNTFFWPISLSNKIYHLITEP